MILEAVLEANANQDLRQVARDIFVEDIRKRRGGDILKPGRTKEGRTEGDLKAYAQKEMTQEYRLKCGTEEHGNTKDRSRVGRSMYSGIVC